MATPSRASDTARRTRTATRSSASSSRSSTTSRAPRAKTSTTRRSPARAKATTKATAPKRSTARSSTRRRTPLLSSSTLRRYLPVALVIAVALMGAFFYPVLRPLYSANREVAQLRAEYDGIQKRNKVLKTEVDRLKTPEGVEEVARTSLGYVRSGENAYVVMPSNPTSTAKQSSKSTSAAKTASAAKAARSSEATAGSAAKQQAALGDAPVWRLLFDALFGTGRSND